MTALVAAEHHRRELAMTIFNIEGDKLYKQRARAALPILVRQARAQEPINYTSLALELGMPNPRNLDYPLGTIGESLIQLGAEWNQKVPPLQCLVINKSTGLPGEGVEWGVPELKNFAAMPARVRRILVDQLLADIYAFGRWRSVLEALHLEEPAPAIPPPQLSMAGKGGGPESEAHIRLKNFTANNPSTLGLNNTYPRVKVEQRLPSGDCIDVFFENERESIAVEIKTANADPLEIVRGLFQCVKYQALLKAIANVEQSDRDRRAILAIGGLFPSHLIPLKNTLGIEIVDRLEKWI
jgi:hypothetical protein